MVSNASWWSPLSCKSQAFCVRTFWRMYCVLFSPYQFWPCFYLANPHGGEAYSVYNPAHLSAKSRFTIIHCMFGSVLSRYPRLLFATIPQRSSGGTPWEAREAAQRARTSRAWADTLPEAWTGAGKGSWPRVPRARTSEKVRSGQIDQAEIGRDCRAAGNKD